MIVPLRWGSALITSDISADDDGDDNGDDYSGGNGDYHDHNALFSVVVRLNFDNFGRHEDDGTDSDAITAAVDANDDRLWFSEKGRLQNWPRLILCEDNGGNNDDGGSSHNDEDDQRCLSVVSCVGITQFWPRPLSYDSDNGSCINNDDDGADDDSDDHGCLLFPWLEVSRSVVGISHRSSACPQGFNSLCTRHKQT